MVSRWRTLSAPRRDAIPLQAVESVKALGFKFLPRSSAMLRAPITAETAQELNVNNDIEAEEQSIPGIVKAILTHSTASENQG